MTEYPFIVKGKVKKVFSFSYNNALDRILFRYRNIFIQTKFARRMSLIDACEEAKKASKGNNERYFVTTDKTGEAYFGTIINCTHNLQVVFVDGKMGILTQQEIDPNSVKVAKAIASNKKLAAIISKALNKNKNGTKKNK